MTARWTPSGELDEQSYADLMERAVENLVRWHHEARQPTAQGFHRFVDMVVSDDAGNKLHQAAIHRTWESHAQWCHRRRVVPITLSLWSHGKSVQRICARAAWIIGHDPSLRIMIVTNSEKNAKRRISMISQIMGSEAYRRLFPHVRITGETTFDIRVYRRGMAADPSIFAAGYGSAGTGARADVFLIDDVADYTNSVERAAERPKVRENIEGQWTSRLVVPPPNSERHWVGYQEGVGTRWHEHDCWGAWLKAEGYCFLIQAVSADNSEIQCAVVTGDTTIDLSTYPWAHDLAREDFDPDAMPSDPPEVAPVIRGYERGKPIGSIPTWDEGGWTQTRLNREERNRPRWHDCGRRQRAFAEGEVLFPHFSLCIEHALVAPDVIPEGWHCACGVDLAGKQRRGTGIVVLVGDGRRIVPAEMLLLSVSGPETSEHLDRIDKRWRPDIFVVEDNGYQRTLREWGKAVHASWTARVHPFVTTGQSKYDPTSGVKTLDVEFKNKAWSVPGAQFEGHRDNCVCAWCNWESSMRTATIHDLRARQNDLDLVMAAWFAREGIMRRLRGGRVAIITAADAYEDPDLAIPRDLEDLYGLPTGPAGDPEPKPGVAKDAPSRKELERRALVQSLFGSIHSMGGLPPDDGEDIW